MHRIRQHSVSQRALWVLLLLLAVVVKPALVLASETHESSHAVQTGHVHAAAQDAHQVPSDEVSDVGDVDPWHGLMHLGQCCSHPSTLPAVDISISPLLAEIAPEIVLITQRANAGTQQPLRPPISV
jgi:hypothetical protein